MNTSRKKSAGRWMGGGRGASRMSLLQIKPIQLHHLDLCSHKVLEELLSGASVGIDLSQGVQDAH